MLEFLRKHTAGVVAKALFVLLILSFGVWGVGDMVNIGSGGDTVAEVGDVEISTQAFEDEFTRELTRLQRQLGDVVDRERARAFGLDREVLQRILTRTLYGQGAADLGVVAPDAQVLATVHSIDAFKGAAGRFDRARFNEVLRNAGLTESGYLALVRSDLINEQYLDTVRAGAAAPDTLARALYAFTAEKRVAETVTVADATAAPPPAPSEEQLARYHKDHADNFTAPEYRALTALVLRAADVAKEIAVSDADIKAAYDERAGEFKTPERRALRQMVLASEDDAKTAAGLIAAGKSFADAAKEIAHMEAKALDIGTVDRTQLLPELADAAFTAPAGTVSAPVKSPLGWHLIEVVSVSPATTRTLDEVADELSAAIAKDRSVEALYTQVNRTEDKLGGGATLEEAAATLNVALLKIAAIDRAGKDTAGAKVAGVPEAKSFLDTAFSTDEGADSLMVEAGGEAYFVLRVDKVTPPALKPLAEVRDAVARGWTADARKDAAEATAKALLAKAKAGRPLADLAKEIGVEVVKTAPFTRAGGDIPPALVGDLFAAAVGDTVMARDAGGSVIARLAAVEKADPAADAAKVAALAGQLATSIRNDLLEQLATGLRADHPVKVHDKAIAGLFRPRD